MYMCRTWWNIFAGVITNVYGNPDGVQSQLSFNEGTLVSYGTTASVSRNGAFLQTPIGVGVGAFVGSRAQGSFAVPLKGGVK